MATATATRPIEFQALPQLRVGKIPDAVAAMPAFASIVTRYRDLNATARMAQHDFTAAKDAITTAHSQDKEAAVTALIDGDTGTKAKSTEAKAIATAESAHAAVIAATTASNRILAQIVEMLKGGEGAEFQAHFTSEQTAAHRHLGGALDDVATCIAEVIELSSAVKWIADARKRDRPGLPTVNRQARPITVHGSPTAIEHLIEHLRTIGAEAGES